MAVADTASVQVSLDSLQKIVLELVDNACKFSTPGTPVEVGAVVADDAYILTIRDHGRGMTAQEMANIGAYQQFDRKLREQQGSGLGLSIARGLVELHGGKIAIESVPNEGTTVSVILALGRAN
jgi:two-component system, sensor histidine kinase and response regulator